MKEAKKIISKEGWDIYYWVNWSRGMNKKFVVMHPASSMNETSLMPLENGLNESGYPTLVVRPLEVNDDAPTEPKFYNLDKCSCRLQQIIEKEGLESPHYLSHSAGFMPIVDYVSRTKNVESIIGICASYSFPASALNKLVFHLFNHVFRYLEYPGSFRMNIAHKRKRITRQYPPDQSDLEGKSDRKIFFSIADVPFKNVKVHTVSGIEMNKWDISNQLREIDNPMLLVYGSKDYMVKSSAGDYIKKQVKGDCKIEIIKGTHSLPLHSPKKVLEIIKNYLE